MDYDAMTDREIGELLAQQPTAWKRRRAVDEVPQERRSMVRQYMQQVVDARARKGHRRNARKNWSIHP